MSGAICHAKTTILQTFSIRCNFRSSANRDSIHLERDSLMTIFHFIFVTALTFTSFLSASGETLSLFQFESKESRVVDKIADQFEIVSRTGIRYEVLVPLDRAPNFIKMAPSAQLLHQNINFELQKLAGFPDGYRDFDKVNETLVRLAKNFPEIAKMETYGQTENGLPLNLLKISDHVGIEEDEPKVIIDAGTHGDELIGVESLLRIVEDMLGKYGSNKEVTKYINSLDLTIIPVVNPEGYRKKERYSGGVDPNRNYPWPDKPVRNSINCISALRDLFERNSYVGSLTIHAYGKLVMYPWGYTKKEIDDSETREEFSKLAAEMSAMNGYTHGPIATTIYVAKGSSSDYYYWKHKTTAIAIEIGTDKMPPKSKIPSAVNDLSASMNSFLAHFAKN